VVVTSTRTLWTLGPERQVAVMIAQGMGNKAIAEALVVSRRAVDGHVERILRELDFSSRTSDGPDRHRAGRTSICRSASAVDEAVLPSEEQPMASAAPRPNTGPDGVPGSAGGPVVARLPIR
jgi:Bacterial regulatory proteins, luxR family